jgi:thiamine-phosphate pyrophosphorylase
VTEAHHATQLCCRLHPGPTARDRLNAILDSGPVASVIIAARPGMRLGAGEVKPLVDLIQKRGVAALVEDDAQLARTVRADGVHLPWRPGILDVFAEARQVLGERYICGADAGRSRHDAMSLGEAGADYVSFGAFADTGEDDRDGRAEFIAWWSEIFEVSGVALDVATVEEAERLVELGADFIAWQVPDGASPSALSEQMRALQATMAEHLT